MTKQQEDIFELAIKGYSGAAIYEIFAKRKIFLTSDDIIDALEAGLERFAKYQFSFEETLYFASIQYDQIISDLCRLEQDAPPSEKRRLLETKARVVAAKTQLLQVIKKNESFLQRVSDILVKFE